MATCEHSSGVAKAGLTTGIIGTSLAGLWALGAGNGNGLLGGLFGGNCNGGVMAAQGAYQAALSLKMPKLVSLKLNVMLIMLVQVFMLLWLRAKKNRI